MSDNLPYRSFFMTLIPSQSPANKKALLLAGKRADCGYDVGWDLFQNYHLARLTVITCLQLVEVGT